MPRDDIPEVQAKRHMIWAQSLPVLAALIAGIGALLSWPLGPLTESKQRELRSAITESVLNDRLNSLTQNMEKEIGSLKQQLSEKAKSAAPATAQIASLSAEVVSLESQVTALNDAIGQSPDRVLAVPILRKDLDNLKESYRQDLGSTQAEINRVYDQNKWFIGLMFTMAVGLLTLAVSNFLQLRKP